LCFIRPDGTVESKDFDWLQCNGFAEHEVAPGAFTGDWWFTWPADKQDNLLEEHAKYLDDVAEYLDDSSVGDSDSDLSDLDDALAGRSMFGFDGGCLGFSEDELDELLMQGIKPWDEEADAALAVLFPGSQPRRGQRSRSTRDLEAAFAHEAALEAEFEASFHPKGKGKAKARGRGGVTGSMFSKGSGKSCLGGGVGGFAGDGRVLGFGKGSIGRDGPLQGDVWAGAAPVEDVWARAVSAGKGGRVGRCGSCGEQKHFMPCDRNGCPGIAGDCMQDVWFLRDDGNFEMKCLLDMVWDPPRSRGGSDGIKAYCSKECVRLDGHRLT